MSLYQKLTKVMDDRDVEGYVQLIHEDAEIVFHKSGNKFTKSEWASMVGGMMGNPKFVSDASRCVYENDEILVSHDFHVVPRRYQRSRDAGLYAKRWTNYSHGNWSNTARLMSCHINGQSKF